MEKIILVNKNNPIKNSFYKKIKFIIAKDIYNHDVQIEEETYKAYIKLYEFLKSININIGIESAYRSLEDQKQTYQEILKLYGKEYADRIVAPVGASEHHTGLALDICVKLNDKYNTNNLKPEEENIFEEIHKYLKKYGFILRYPKGKENVTGYPYEPWHIRYVGEFVSNIITNNNYTLEEYLTNNSGILIIDKPKDITSRDVVDDVVKKFNTRKVGHTGTLDPLATGVLVICVGKATKLVQELTSSDKEYIASVTLGIKTDTIDRMGKILFEEDVNKTKEEIINVLNSFKGTYSQEVPIYSAVKKNGKKLYEYAREGINIELPRRDVEIKEIKLLDDIEYKNNKTMFKFRCIVSKGTYIRSLINDIANKLDTIGIMTGLRRIRQGNFKIEDSIKLEDINVDSLRSIDSILPYKKVQITDDIRKKVVNGALVDNIYNEDFILFMENNEVVALYKISSDKNKLKSYIMFRGGMV